MIPIEISKILVKQQMGQVHTSLDMKPEKTPKHQEVHHLQKRWMFKLSEWLGVAFINAGNKLVQYACKHEALLPQHR